MARVVSFMGGNSCLVGHADTRDFRFALIVFEELLGMESGLWHGKVGGNST